MHFQTKISQITMYFQSKNIKNDAFSKYILSYTVQSFVAVPQSGHKK